MRWGGPLPVCWFPLNGSCGFGFIALVCSAESELVLCGGGQRVAGKMGKEKRKEKKKGGDLIIAMLGLEAYRITGLSESRA